MTRLILLNGAPAVGKSTLARRYAEDHPFALVLDIDQVRRMLGRWREDPSASGLLARSIALAAARAHLESGHDVVVPQLTARVEFIERIAATAAEANTRFTEVYVHAGEEEALRRFEERTRAAADPTHVDAAATLVGGEEALRAMHAKVTALSEHRPEAVTVVSVPGDVEATYRGLLAVLEA